MKAFPAHGGQKSSTGEGLTLRKPETRTFTVNLISDPLQEATRRSFKPSGRVFRPHKSHPNKPEHQEFKRSG